MPDAPTTLQRIGAGLFGEVGHIALTLSVGHDEASRLAPFEYIALLWPLLADVFIFDIHLSTACVLAAPLILAGAAIAAAEKGNRAVD